MLARLYICTLMCSWSIVFPCDLTSRLLYFFRQAVPNLRYPVTNISTIADSVPRPPLVRQNASHGIGILLLKLFFLLNCSLHFFTFFLKGPFTDQVNDLICWEEPTLVLIPSPLLESPSQSSKVMYAIKMWYLSVLIESTIYQRFCFKSIDCYYLLDLLTVQFKRNFPREIDVNVCR